MWIRPPLIEEKCVMYFITKIISAINSETCYKLSPNSFEIHVIPTSNFYVWWWDIFVENLLKQFCLIKITGVKRNYVSAKVQLMKLHILNH